MDFDKVLLFVGSQKRQDLLIFLKTGIADDELQALINDNAFCQEAIQSYLKFQEEILLLAEFQRRIAPKLRRIKPQWHADFIRFVMSHDFSKEFENYVNEDAECQQMFESLLREQEQMVEEASNQQKNPRSKKNLAPAEEYTRTLEDHRQRWSRLDNL